MANARFELNRAGVREILRSPEVASLVTDAAQRVASASSADVGGEYAVRSEVGRRRARAAVVAVDRTANVAEVRERTMVRNLGAAG